MGRGRISILYDQYVEVGFATHEAYERAKLVKDVQLDRMRDRGKRKKEVGGKVLRLTKEVWSWCYNVPFYTVPHIPCSRECPVGQMLLLRHGLHERSRKQQFQSGM